MKNVYGLIVAIETEAVFRHYGEVRELDAPHGFKLYCISRADYEVYVLQTGMGEIAAAAGTQFLISKCGVSVIVNFGVVGGLTPDMKKRKLCLVDRVVHYKYDCSEFMDLVPGQVDGHDSVYLETSDNLRRRVLSVIDCMPSAVCCSGDKFVGTEAEKRHLHERFGGDVCDMESAGIVLTCEINRVPCVLIKAVSDGLADGAGGFFEELRAASLDCVAAADTVMALLAADDAGKYSDS